MHRIRMILAVLVAVISAPTIAEVVTYEFEGTINSPIGTLTAGSAFLGSFTYDTTSPELQGVGDPNFGLYLLNEFEVFFGSEFIRLNSGTIKIDNRSTFDQIATQALTSIGVVEGGVLGGIDFSASGQFDLALADLSATALSSDALPGPGLTLSDFPLSPQLTFFNSNTGLFVIATVTSFSAREQLPDTDGDGLPDYDPDNPELEDRDDDNDGVTDDDDTDALDPMLCEDRDGDTCDDCAVQVDGFGPLDDFDPLNDGPDADGDGICDAGDNSFDDWDGDGIGDIFDSDDDNDGVLDQDDNDSLDPFVCEDRDGDTCDDCAVQVDGFGPLDDFDPLNDGPDADGDGICDAGDTNVSDSDGDGVDDLFDNCPSIANPDQADSNQDGFGDACVPTDTAIGANVIIGSNPVIGLGTTIRKNTAIGDNVTIGMSVLIAENSTLGDNVWVGDQTTIRKKARIGSNVSIGSNVTIAKNVEIAIDAQIGDGTIIGKNVVVGAGAIIGNNVVIRKGAKILPGAAVPDGTVVPKNTTFPVT